MDYNILKKKINFIEFHDFLCRIDTGSVTSHLHYNANNMLNEIERKGETSFNGMRFTKRSFKKHLQDEEGEVSEFKLQKTKYGPEAVLKFSNGNGLTIPLKEERQFAQIYEYLLEQG